MNLRGFFLFVHVQSVWSTCYCSSLISLPSLYFLALQVNILKSPQMLTFRSRVRFTYNPGHFSFDQSDNRYFNSHAFQMVFVMVWNTAVSYHLVHFLDTTNSSKA